MYKLYYKTLENNVRIVGVFQQQVACVITASILLTKHTTASVSSNKQTINMMKIPTILHNLFPNRSNSSSSIIIDGPTDNDVLCGRDRNFAKHPGNILYRFQVERQASSYAIATTKQAKMKITKAIVQVMQTQYGSRFLRRTEANQWEVLSNLQARDKTSHALRFINNGHSSYSSQRTDEESSDQVLPRQSVDDIDTAAHHHHHPPTRVQCQVGEAPCVVSPSFTKSCSHAAAANDATLAIMHQRQQELLRSSLQNDRIMDIHCHPDGQPLALEQLLNSPLFTMSSLGAGASHPNMSMSDVRSVVDRGVSSDVFYNLNSESFNNNMTTTNALTNVDEQERLDSIRTMDMVDMMLNGPIEDTLRSEELNFLLSESTNTMDLTF